MDPESIHEEFNEEPIEQAASTTDDGEAVVAADEGGEPQNISEGPAETTTEQVADNSGEQAAAETQEASEQAPATGDEKTVPYGALHQEREMRKDLQAQLAESQKAIGQLMGLKDQLDELRKGAQTDDTKAQQEALEAKFEEDPIGALREQQEAIQAKLDASDKQSEDQTKAQEQMSQFMNEVTRQVGEYEKDHPDYPQAFNYLMEARMNEYKAMGVTSPQELQVAFDREAISLAQGAMARGKNPAEVAYEMAKVRGYVKSDKPAEEQPKGETLEDTMDRLEKGAVAAKTNQGGNATSIDDTPTLDEIGKMSDKDFDAYWDNMEKQANGGSIL